MRIVIDLQAAQTSGSRHRGIGRYSMALAKAMAEQPRGHRLIIALNGYFDDSIDSIREEFDPLLPQEDIRLWYPSGDQTTPRRRQPDQLIREAFIASLRPDIVHVSSLFEGLGDAATSSAGVFTNRLVTAVTLFDLIPYIYKQQYLPDPAVEQWYVSKVAHLRRADLLLGISESARREAVDVLGIPEERTVNISSAVGEEFQVVRVSHESARDLKHRYGLNRPFVMYTGGIDHRKNIEGLIAAFAKLPLGLRDGYQLAVVCSAREEHKRMLFELAKREGLPEGTLVLTGFVPENDLVILYNLCTLFVFPSWHEGFGLPALEAMSCGAPVVAANTSSLPEVVGRADALFDPRDVDSIADKIGQALRDEKFRADLACHGLQHAKNFSWARTAQRALEAFEGAVAEKRAHVRKPAEAPRRPRLAFVSPLPSERSGIADYSAQLIPDLSRYYDIDVITPQAVVSDQSVLGSATLRTPEWFSANATRYDRVLYHFGNSHFHEHMFDLLERVPGVVVLHDFFLSGIQDYISRSAGRPGSWMLELYRSHGYAAVAEDLRASDSELAMYKYPCNFGVLQKALGTIIHSEHSRELANRWYGETLAADWVHIPLVRAPTVSMDRRAARMSLGIDPEAFVVCSFGLVNPTKQSHRLLDAWMSVLGGRTDCELIFVGANDAGRYGEELKSSILASGAEARARITGWTDEEVYRGYLAAADVGVQLRTQSRGETSASVLDCMGHGLATIVNANGSMADLPVEAVVMLPDHFTDAELAGALESLYLDQRQRESLGETAAGIVASEHSPTQCSEQYAEAIERFYDADQTSVRALVECLGNSLAPDCEEADLQAIAEAVALSLPPRQPSRQLFVDVSHLVSEGPERNPDGMLIDLLLNPPAGFRTEPVYAAEGRSRYMYARKFALELLGGRQGALLDEVIEVHPHDRYLGLVPEEKMAAWQLQFLESLRQRGVEVTWDMACTRQTSGPAHA